MHRFKPLTTITLFLSLITFALASAPSTNTSHGFSVFGKLKYDKDFTHYDYVNPDAPKGGKVVFGAQGTFDSLNPFIVRGNPAAGILLTYAHLLDTNHDRAGEGYAYVAESVEMADDKSFVIFHLNPKARFSDGVEIDADTVIWSFETVRDKGFPMYRTYYKNVSKVEKLSKYAVKFTFNTTKNAELPQILGQLAMLPKHFYEKHPFDSTSLDIPPSSGPYMVEKLEPGRSITYTRLKNWWGADLPSQRGNYNFDEIKEDYYLDGNAMLEAFKAHKIDFRIEASIKNWKTAYDFPAVHQGLVIKKALPQERTSPTYGFFFNTRRDIFKDVRVRQALTMAFNFNWANKNLFYGAYQRNLSNFDNSCFAARDLPKDEELNELNKFKDKLAPEVLSNVYELPNPKSEKEERLVLEQSRKLLEEAGWNIKGNNLVDKKGNPFVFEIIISDKSLEKLCLQFTQTLRPLGITVKIRTLDTAAYTHREENKNFDMILTLIPQSESLGNEQRDYFGSAKADTPGSLNHSGVKNPVVDAIIEDLVIADSRGNQCARGRALDRVLLWGFYVIPAWHRNEDYVAYWDKFDHPKKLSPYYPYVFYNWWYDEGKAKKLATQLDNLKSENVVARTYRSIKGWVFGEKNKD